MDEMVARLQEIVHETPIHLLFLGLVAFFIFWAALGIIKDLFVWVFWHIGLYLMPFFLWYFHPQLKPWYVWLWVALGNMVASAHEMVEEEIKPKV